MSLLMAEAPREGGSDVRWHPPKRAGHGGKAQHCTSCGRPIPRGHGAKAGKLTLGNVCQRCVRKERLADGTLIIHARNGPTVRLGGPRMEEWPIPLHTWSLWHSFSTGSVPASHSLNRRQARVAELAARGRLR